MKRLLVALVLLWPMGAVADVQAGLDAYKRDDYATALREWRPLAEAGDASAQYNLAAMYRKGKGVPLDTVEAVYWYRLAAAQGYARAQNRLGIQYANGEGVVRDELEAIKWHRLAAEQGDADAQNRLGLIYDIGQGIAKDLVEAYAWFYLAAAQGYEYASKNKTSLERRMTSAQLAEAQKLSRELCAKIPGCVK